MERILLVEPDYNNKYPPIGLMKISTYYKKKGDYVEFYKGTAPFNIISRADKVFITSLFTFYFDKTVETVLHYLNYLPQKKVFLGGIAATLLTKEFRAATQLDNILTGQLTDSSILGYNDHVNIDILPLDYDILDDVEYQYGIENNFFSYTTRGCPRGCSFCAVKTLEPLFCDTNNIIEQVSCVREQYGDKRNLMLMDNNVLFSKNLQQICEDLISLGFRKGEATYIPANPAKMFFAKIARRKLLGNKTWLITDNFIFFLKNFKKRIKKEDIFNQLSSLIEEAENSSNTLDILFSHQDFIISAVEKYRSKKPLQRYVDFNQGLDARLISENTMQIISSLPLRPVRLAYDDISSTGAYQTAFEIAYRHGVRHFSNYMLYNFEDTPEDLWQRAYNNIHLYNSYPDITAFSFPMKYAPINMTDRSYIGVHWNKKYLSAMNIILNVTKGVIAKELDFFQHAYGSTSNEFKEILSMPSEFIKYRDFFEKLGLVDGWRNQFRQLSTETQKQLVCYLSGEIDCFENPILVYYKITKSQIEHKRINISAYI